MPKFHWCGLPEWLLNIPEIYIRNKKDGNFVYSEPYMKAFKRMVCQNYTDNKRIP